MTKPPVIYSCKKRKSSLDLFLNSGLGLTVNIRQLFWGIESWSNALAVNIRYELDKNGGSVTKQSGRLIKSISASNQQFQFHWISHEISSHLIHLDPNSLIFSSFLFFIQRMQSNSAWFDRNLNDNRITILSGTVASVSSVGGQRYKATWILPVEFRWHVGATLTGEGLKLSHTLGGEALAEPVRPQIDGHWEIFSLLIPSVCSDA